MHNLFQTCIGPGDKQRVERQPPREPPVYFHLAEEDIFTRYVELETLMSGWPLMEMHNTDDGAEAQFATRTTAAFEVHPVLFATRRRWWGYVREGGFRN